MKTSQLTPSLIPGVKNRGSSGQKKEKQKEKIQIGKERIQQLGTQPHHTAFVHRKRAGYWHHSIGEKSRQKPLRWSVQLCHAQLSESENVTHKPQTVTRISPFTKDGCHCKVYNRQAQRFPKIWQRSPPLPFSMNQTKLYFGL